MENVPTISSATPDSFWAALNVLTERIAENERLRKEAMAENARQMAENARQMAENERLRKKAMAETERLRKKADAKHRQARAEFELSMKALSEQQAKTDRQIENVNKTLGSWANNQGSFAEEYFFNSFEKGQQNFFGEKFDDIEKNIKGFKTGFKDEYDILLVNGKSVGIIEVKYKAHENDLPKVIKKAETFRRNFPEYQNHKVYLGLATLVFSPGLEQECINEGIAVIKQAGDTVIITDEHLKAF